MRITAWWLRWTSFYGHDIWVTYDDVTMKSSLNMTSNTCQFDQIRGLKLVQTHINAQSMPGYANIELQKLEPVRSLRFVPLSKKVQIHLRALIWKILVRVYWMGKHELWREGGVEKRVGCSDLKKASRKVDSDWLVCVWRTLLIGQHRTTSAQDWKFGVTKKNSKIHQI